MFNALTFDKDIMKRAGSKNCSRVFYAGNSPLSLPLIENFQYIDDSFNGKLCGNIYLASILLPDNIIDGVIEHVLSTKCRIIINACSTLEEVGTCDKRYGATPVGLAHKFGLLDGAYIAGGVYLDKDDIELIIQSRAEVILTPSTSMGNGDGIPPLRMLASLGATVHLGTGQYDYNTNADLIFEKQLISLAVSGVNCTRSAVDEDFLNLIVM